MQFSLNVLNQFISAAGAFLGMSLSDRMPRRKVLVFGTIVVAFMLFITGGLSKLWVENANTGTVDPRVGHAAVISYFSFWFVYVVTIRYTYAYRSYSFQVLFQLHAIAGPVPR